MQSNIRIILSYPKGIDLVTVFTRTVMINEYIIKCKFIDILMYEKGLDFNTALFISDLDKEINYWLHKAECWDYKLSHKETLQLLVDLYPEKHILIVLK